MPTETPHFPQETYQSLLSHGQADGLPLLAYEIASYDRRSRVAEIGLSVLQVIGAIAVVAVAAVAALYLIRES
jgi:hypothetical protein